MRHNRIAHLNSHFFNFSARTRTYINKHVGGAHDFVARRAQQVGWDGTNNANEIFSIFSRANAQALAHYDVAPPSTEIEKLKPAIGTNVLNNESNFIEVRA